MKLTEPQLRALKHLASHDWATPANIGAAILAGRETRQIRSAQGYGRVGGTVAARLAKAGLVYRYHWSGQGFPGYRISPLGRAELATAKGGPAR